MQQTHTKQQQNHKRLHNLDMLVVVKFSMCLCCIRISWTFREQTIYYYKLEQQHKYYTKHNTQNNNNNNKEKKITNLPL